MAKKIIFNIDLDLPGDEFEYIQFDSDRSLLDADIVLYKVGFGGHYTTGEYQGTPLFNHERSVRVKQNLQHWRSELVAATDAGKLVIVFLTKPLSYFHYTGKQELSGTGRSQVTKNLVAPVTSYSAIPNITFAEGKSGREVRLTKEGAYLAPYWHEFSEYSAYEAFVEGKFTHALLTTKAGEKTVAAAVLGKGSLLFLPPLRFDEAKFTKYDAKKEQTFWTTEALKFGKRLTATLVALSETLLSDSLSSPPPPWTLESAFFIPEEGVFYREITEVVEKISTLQRQRMELKQRLEEAGSIRALLYEQGKPLENAVRNALILLGFSAVSFAGSDSEFDVIFESPEGRCLGEVEGKDNKAINIDKFSQLERNLQEDFARENITEYAKGVLFGNAERLRQPSERGTAFTAKCITAAKRLHVALVRTVDLFEPIKYLRTNADPEYAKACRQAIFDADGDMVVFPTVPISTASEISDDAPSV